MFTSIFGKKPETFEQQAEKSLQNFTEQLRELATLAGASAEEKNPYTLRINQATQKLDTAKQKSGATERAAALSGFMVDMDSASKDIDREKIALLTTQVSDCVSTTISLLNTLKEFEIDEGRKKSYDEQIGTLSREVGRLVTQSPPPTAKILVEYVQGRNLTNAALQSQINAEIKAAQTEQADVQKELLSSGKTFAMKGPPGK